ncbi:hypothetical protein C1645_803827 [Glomus cerebriforme]|uniref:F-box domain-containing protein n=1 Tax=Glomus cerebriforme TaxID=658196 RepID=A0A397T6G8_9GLOM|nr:hypothetical protein C1645_803827 [Glomus cerebriforme]
MNYFLTTQTGFSVVPLDCLQEIFQYLENDMKTLYSCMLVNRTWCRINIALLWRRPFEHSGPKSTRRYSELIRTYITCLPKSSKMEIYETGYKIPSHPRPLFPYHKYLKELDCEKLDEAVEEWILRFGFDEYRPEDPEDVVYTELLKLLLSRCNGLWNLRLGRYNDEYKFPPVATFPRIKYTLANLRRFEFLGDMDCLVKPGLDNLYQFLDKLSNISNNLEYINVDMTEDEESFSGVGLRKLIKSQKNLSVFRYNQEHSDIEKTKEFVKALSHNANTVKNIEFDSIPLNVQCLDPLKKFNNLECMQFAYCYENEEYILSENEETVEHSPSQLKVEKLIFHKGDLTSVTLEILRLVNKSARELTVDNVVPGLFEHISEHCPNVTYLATAISQKTVESLEYLSTSKIEHLILKTLENKDIDTKDFQRIGKNLSLDLNHLSLNFNISVEELSSLLKECKSPLESLCLKFDDVSNKDEYLKVIIDFAKKDDLKELKEFKFFINKDIEAKDIFSKDILEEAKLLIPSILRETREPFSKKFNI